MITRLAILNSDAVNKYHYRIMLSALEGGLWDNAVYGMPMHLGHDLHRPIGWMVPFGLFMQPKLVRLLGRQMITETDDEQKSILEGQRKYFTKMTWKLVDQYESDFLPHIKDHISENKKYLHASGLAVFEEKIVENIFPGLLSNLDKNGLLYLSDLLVDFDYIGQGTFKNKKSPLCIYAHPFFRRSLSRHNNFHFIFLDELLSHVKNPEVSVRIALDWDIIGYAPSWLPAQELEFWFGPKYDDDIGSIVPGHTKHVSDEFERMYYGISATEFVWKSNDHLHEFEMEELREDEAPTLTDNYACRYTHSIYDKDSKSFQHFDGAIRSYAPEEYFERIDKKMTEAGRRSDYKKLFRIDGKLPLNDWKSLCTNYLQGNPLIYEYFGLENPGVQKILDEQPLSLKERLIPFSINENDGIRIMVSYHERNEKNIDRHIVSINDIFTIGEETDPFVEYDVIELKKALSRLGANLVIPEHLSFFIFEDSYWNIPCVFHGGPDAQSDLNLTVQALKNVLITMKQKKRRMVISFTLAWNMEDKEVRLSIIGHSIDLSSWITQVKPLPVTHSEFQQWLDIQNNYLSSLAVANPFSPQLWELAKFDGVLYMKRRAVDPNYNLEFVSDEKGIAYKMAIPADETELLNAVNAGEIRPVMCYKVAKITCSRSGMDYANSPYSKWLDKDVRITVEDFDMLHRYWSDKPA